MEEFFVKYPCLSVIKTTMLDMGINSSTFYALSDEEINQSLKENPTSLFSFISKYNFEKGLLFSKQNLSYENEIEMHIENEASNLSFSSADESLISLLKSNPPDNNYSACTNKAKRRKLQRITDDFTFKENDIYFILQSSLQGRIVLGKYKNYRIVDFPMLKHLVIYHYISQDPIEYTITTESFLRIAEQIHELMPSVDAQYLYYPYTASSADGEGSSEGGTLYWYYKECRRHLREACILLNRETSKETSCTQTNSDNVEDCNASFYECIIDPDREKYNCIEVGAKWMESFQERTKKLLEKEGKNFTLTPISYITTFPCLNDTIALSLLESDFGKIIEKLGKDKVINEDDILKYGSLFQNNWPILSNAIVELIKSSKINEVKAFRKTHSNLVDQGKHNSLLALFALPLYMTVTKPFGKDKISESFILLIENPEEFEKKSNDLKNKKLEESDSIVHMVFCGTLEHISKANVIFNHNIYSYSDPLKAVDICFKCHASLRSWPYACDYVWAFIQLWVYKIPHNKSPFFVNKAFQVVNRCIYNLKQF